MQYGLTGNAKKFASFCFRLLFFNKKIWKKQLHFLDLLFFPFFSPCITLTFKEIRLDFYNIKK